MNSRVKVTACDIEAAENLAFPVPSGIPSPAMRLAPESRTKLVGDVTKLLITRLEPSDEMMLVSTYHPQVTADVEVGPQPSIEVDQSPNITSA